LSFAGVSASAGQVIQVLSATDETLRQTSSTSFITVSNTLSVTITPSSASNKIFIIASSGFRQLSGGNRGFASIFRDATNLGNATYGMAIVGGATEANTIAMSFLDSPNTTSAITYQVYIRSGSGGTVDLNGRGVGSELVKGSITCFEIKG
jgi:hypothetical protein